MRAAPLALLAALASSDAGAAEAPDFSRVVSLGDGLTAGFVNGSLFDGSTRPEGALAMGQRESYAVHVARALGAEPSLPLVAWPGRPLRNAIRREPAVCVLEPELFAMDTVAGRAGRIDPQARPSVLAVPDQTVGDAIAKRWSIDPGDPSTVASDEDVVLGLPWALEGAPPRSQLETALALEPTFVTVWLGTEDALRAAAEGDDRVTDPAAFATHLGEVVDRLAAAGARGAIATVPDVTTFPYFVTHDALLRLLQTQQAERDERERDETPERVRASGLRVLVGVPRGAFVLQREISLRTVEDILGGHQDAPLLDNHVLRAGEVRRIRAATRAYNRAIADAAARHGWALVDTAALFRAWRRRGVVVGGRTLTTEVLGGLFDFPGKSLSPTGHALVAAEFLRAIDATYGTNHAAPDAAAVLDQDPLAPCSPR